MLLSLQQAMVGEVFPALRAVTVEWSQTLVRFFAYVDGPLCEEDALSLSCISAEVAADFWSGVDVDYEVVQVDVQGRIDDSRIRVYRRREDAPRTHGSSMSDDQVRRSLLVEVHRCIECSAEETVAKLGRIRTRPVPAPDEIDPEALLHYPPTDTLTTREEHVLRAMQLSSFERSALTKLIADSSAAAFFQFFNLIDGTADPEITPPDETWLGAWVVAPKDDRDRDMLHDEFYESYHEYLEAR
ncbi:MAG: hypothetical protein ABL886_10470 [Rhodoglobus sp.]